jgi:hypothetical protein
MNLYAITYVAPTSDAPTRMRAAWAGTQADAKAKHKALCEEHERFNVDKPVPANVPTDKPGLLAWLNEREVLP